MQKIENETEKFDNHLKINKLQISESCLCLLKMRKKYLTFFNFEKKSIFIYLYCNY